MNDKRLGFIAIMALAAVIAMMGCAKDEDEELAVDRAITGTWYQLWSAGANYTLFRNPVDSSLNQLVITQESISYNGLTLVTADSGFRAKDGLISDSIPGGRRPRYYYKVVSVTGKGNVLCTISAVGGGVPKPDGGVTLENAEDRFCKAADTTAWKQ